LKEKAICSPETDSSKNNSNSKTGIIPRINNPSLHYLYAIRIKQNYYKYILKFSSLLQKRFFSGMQKSRKAIGFSAFLNATLYSDRPQQPF